MGCAHRKAKAVETERCEELCVLFGEEVLEELVLASRWETHLVEKVLVLFLSESLFHRGA